VEVAVHVPRSDGHRVGIAASTWILRTFLGWTAGFVLAIACIIAVDSLGVSGMQSPLPLGMGLGVGMLQARLVAPMIGRRREWVLATTIGLTLPFLIADVGRLLGGALPYSLAAYVALGGVLAAALQERLLCRAAVAGTWWWLIVTPIGWLLAGSTVWVAEWLPKNVTGLIGAGRYVAVVLSGGVVLGVAGAAAWRQMRTGPVASRSAQAVSRSE
jgi:hypothetical protein